MQKLRLASVRFNQEKLVRLIRELDLEIVADGSVRSDDLLNDLVDVCELLLRAARQLRVQW